MNLEQVKSLVEKQESHTLEYKATTAHLRAAFATACAFLNGNGGTILIGVKDSGKIVGQDVSDGTRKEIASEANKIEPASQGHLKIDYIPLADNHKYVVAINVKSGDHAPYVYDGRPYQRDESSTNKMSQQRYDQLISKRMQLNFSWEKANALGYKIKDLDHDLIFGVVRKAVALKRMPEEALRQDIPKLLEALHLTTDDHLNNAAVVLFAKKIKADYFQCSLKLARFKGIDRNEFLDNNIVYGNIFEFLENGMLFVRRHLPVAGRIEPGKLERVDTPLIPFDAIREALINAFCHREYSFPGGSIGLAVYDDRMEIFNDGGLLPGISLEKIKTGFSKLRNPIIAEVFHRCNLIEKWGRGIPKIIKSCMAMNDPEPEFIVDEVEFKVVFRFPTSLAPTIASGINEISMLTRRQQEIINILEDSNALSIREIQQKFGQHIPVSTLRDDLMALRKIGLLGSSGRAQNAIWFLNRMK